MAKCLYCNDNFKSGLLDHMLKCDCRGDRTKEEISDDANYSLATGDPIKDWSSEVSPKPRRFKPQPERQPKTIDIPSFVVLPRHVPLLLEIDLATALADYILETGSDNKAIMALAHQLKQAKE